MVRIYIFAIISVTTFLFASCKSHHTERTRDTDPRGWDNSSPVIIEFENSDTLTNRDIIIMLRLDDNFKENLLPLTLLIIDPDSSKYRESFSADLSPLHKQPRQYAEICYRENTQLKKFGTYSFIIIPEKKIKGISSVGIKTHLANPNPRPENTVL